MTFTSPPPTMDTAKIEACFDPPLEVVSTRNPITYNERTADPNHPDLAGLLVKNKDLLAELRNLQNKLFVKETSLQEMKSELESYKEDNSKQSFQIISLKNDIKDLEDLIACLTRIKSLKSINIQSLDRGNWDLNERIIELENRLRVHLVEREKAEQKADLLEKKLAGANGFTPYMNMTGQEDTLGSFTIKRGIRYLQIKVQMGSLTRVGMFRMKVKLSWPKTLRESVFHSEGPKQGQKIWDKYQDLIHKEKQKCKLDRPPYSFGWETKTAQSHYQKLLGQLASLLSSSVVPIPAPEEAVKERIREIGANEPSWESRTKGPRQEIQMLTKQLEQLHHRREESAQTEEKCRDQNKPLKHLEGKVAVNDFFQGRLGLGRNKENSRTKNSQIGENSKMFKQLEKDNKQQTLLNIKQNLQIATTQRLEEEIQQLQKQLSDLKLSNKNMKTQLKRVNVLKDKTIQKFRQSLIKVEAMKGKAVMKTDNLKTTLELAKEEARWDKDKAHQMLDAATPELCTADTLEEVSGPPQERVSFRETIMKMLGFNMKTADKEIITHLRLVIQAYETSNKSKITSDCEPGQNNA
ncbi:PREDICTED: coiled-coil domain-containing protein 170-like [Miniopterus natalensis]|uniref:coiled-coil domain-containing protein 170-like n=1 Tax=Miniopterus natalensis TaxID=291302 RepID=UPI0007A6AF1B|nr:PREDICTED: coiled-coil domain-containing protein 170-like [Miniopterus natalensis]